MESRQADNNASFKQLMPQQSSDESASKRPLPLYRPHLESKASVMTTTSAAFSIQEATPQTLKDRHSMFNKGNQLINKEAAAQQQVTIKATVPEPPRSNQKDRIDREMEQADLDARRNRVYSQAEQSGLLARKHTNANHQSLMLRSSSGVVDAKATSIAVKKLDDLLLDVSRGADGNNSCKHGPAAKWNKQDNQILPATTMRKQADASTQVFTSRFRGLYSSATNQLVCDYPGCLEAGSAGKCDYRVCCSRGCSRNLCSQHLALTANRDDNSAQFRDRGDLEVEEEQMAQWQHDDYSNADRELGDKRNFRARVCIECENRANRAYWFTVLCIIAIPIMAAMPAILMYGGDNPQSSQ